MKQTLSQAVTEAFDTNEAKQEIHNVKPGQVYEYIPEKVKDFSWDTTGYRMLVVNKDGDYLAYRAKDNKVIAGTGRLSKADIKIQLSKDAAPKELVAEFDGVLNPFWMKLFSNATNYTKTAIRINALVLEALNEAKT